MIREAFNVVAHPTVTLNDSEREQARLAALLDVMERGTGMQSIDVSLPMAERLRMAAIDGVAPGYGYANVGPVFDVLLPVVWAHLAAHHVEPGISCAYFDWLDDDGRIVVHLGFEIGDQALPDAESVRVVELEPTQVAAVFHRGPMTDFTDTFLSAVHWIESHGYEIAERSRELYHAWSPDDPDATVVELQSRGERATQLPSTRRRHQGGSSTRGRTSLGTPVGRRRCGR